MPTHVKRMRVKADVCPKSSNLPNFDSGNEFALSLKSKKSFQFVVSNDLRKFSGKQLKVKFLNRIKSGTSRVR